MLRIDAHQHFWKFDAIRDSWISEEMSVIRKDFLPADLRPLLQQLDFDGCVTVQSDQTEAENDFQLQNADENELVKGVVGWVDLQSPTVESRLEFYADRKKMKGFRHILQGEADRALMLRPAFKNGIALLKKYGFTYDILIFPDQLPYALELVNEFPEQPFVIDHLAKPLIKKGEITEWQQQVRAFASKENVYCKASGMVTEADWHNWKPADFTPYLETVTETFGMKRIMYGSDWPVCLLPASYEQAYRLVADYYSTFSEDEQALLFGGNAERFYQL